MSVLVYVEGPGDRAALDELFQEAAQEARIKLNFIPKNNKDRLIREVPGNAARHLASNPEDWVFALPDLFPMDQNQESPYAHSTAKELAQVLREQFQQAASGMKLPAQALSRFRPHCLKHDLEVLLLAVPELLRKRLGTEDKLERNWRKPVEDQNGQKPPGYVVEELFKRYAKKKKYDKVLDPARILKGARLEDLRAACGQCFDPFADELLRVLHGKPLD
jgi:hypothetical protein